LLAGNDERYTAQNILTYWANFLYRSWQQVEDDSLADFKPSLVPELADAVNPYGDFDRPPEDGLSWAPGWQRLIGEAVRAVANYRVTVLVGAAGGGRAVLVHAGLLPALKSERILPGSANWEYLLPFTPGKEPLADLARALSPSATETQIANQATQLLRDPAGQVRRLVTDRTRPVVVVVERLEQVLLQAHPARVRSFADALLALIEMAERGHRVILASDPGGLARLQTFGPFGRRLLQGQVLVTFTASELRQMVLEPAKRVGLHFDDGLIDRLLLDVQGDPAALALLHFTLQRLWDARTGNRITHEAYDRIGGGRLAVSRCAEELYAALEPDQQKVAERILLRLIRPVFGVGVSCQGVPLNELLPEAERKGPGPQVLAKLVEAGLVVHIGATPGGATEFAPVHESLATAWPRFLYWLEQSREHQQWRLRLRAAAEQWRTEKEESGALWSGAVLELALKEARQLKAAGAPLDGLEQDFLRASKAKDRRRRLVWWGVIVVGIVMLVASIIAYILYQMHLTRVEKDKASAEAKLRGKANLINAAWAVKEGSGLAASPSWDTSGAFLWYAKAWEYFNSSAQDAKADLDLERLRQNYLIRLGVARRQLPVLVGMLYDKKLSPTAWTPDGRVVLTIGDEKGKKDCPVARVWRWSNAPAQEEWVSSPLPWGQAPRPSQMSDVGVYLSSDGRIAVITDKIKTGEKETGWRAHVWSTDKAELDGTFEDYGVLKDAGFSPNGGYFAVVSSPPEPGRPVAREGANAVEAASSTSGVTIWQARQWQKPQHLRVPAKIGALLQIAFSPGSDRLAVTVASNPADSKPNSVVCLEWTLEAFPPAGDPKEYFGYASLPLGSSRSTEETTFAVYGSSGENQLLFVSRGRADQRPDCWLYRTRLDGAYPFHVPPDHHNEPITHAAFSPRGDRLATADAEGKVVLWNVSFDRDTPALRYQTKLNHTARVFYTDFSPDGQYVATASRDRRAVVWDADTGRLKHPPIYHSGSVDQARFTPDSRELITSCQGAVYRWDLASVEPRPLVLGDPYPVRTLTTNPQGQLVLAAGSRQTLPGHGRSTGWAQVWDATTGTPRTPTLLHGTGIRHAAISPGEIGLVSTVGEDGEVRVWSLAAPDTFQSIPPKAWAAIYTAFAAYKEKMYLLAVAREKPNEPSGQGSVRVWTISAKGEPTEIGRFEYDAPFTAASFSPDCKRLVAFTGEGDRGVAVVWEVGSNNTPIVLKGQGSDAHSEPITSAVFSENGDQLLTTSRDDTAVVWSGSEWRGKKLQGRPGDVVECHTADVLFGMFSLTGRRIVTAGADRQAIVWEWAHERGAFFPVAALDIEANPVQALFSPDEEERYIVTAGDDATTRLWEAKHGRVVITKRHPGQVRKMTWHRSNAGLKLQVLGVETARAALPLGRAARAAISPGEISRVTVSEWDLTPATPPDSEELRAIAELTAARRLVDVEDLIETTPLPLEIVYQRWQDKAREANRAGAGAQVEPAEWHQREAGWSEATGHWPAAYWQLQRALEVLPKGRPRFHVLAHRARAHVQLARLAERDPGRLNAQSEWGISVQELTEALELKKDDFDLLRLRGEAQARLNKHTEAIKDFVVVLKIYPEDSETRAQLAKAYREINNLKAAVIEYDKAIRPGAPDPDLLVQRGAVLANPAIAQFKRAFDDYLAAARQFKSQQRPEDAGPAYEKAISLSNIHVKLTRQELARIHFERGQLHTLSRQHEAARQHFKKATELDELVWNYWNELGSTHQRMNDWKEAAEAFDMAIKLNPKNLSLLRSRAQSLIQLREWDQAAGAYEAVIELDPKALQPRLLLAAVYLQPAGQERWKEASRCLTEAAKIFPYESFIWVDLAAVQLAVGDVDDYLVTRDKMLKQFDDSRPDAANNVAWALALAAVPSEDRPRAVELAEKAMNTVSTLPRSADYTNYLNTLGAVLYRAGRSEEAILKLQEATKQRPQVVFSPDKLAAGNAFDLLFQAMAEYALARVDQARETLGKADGEIRFFNGNNQPDTPSQSLSRVWDRLQLQVLRGEADKLINQR
jgi:WD40 repeat protein/tetratricopeptide (TPR) repeat protein